MHQPSASDPTRCQPHLWRGWLGKVTQLVVVVVLMQGPLAIAGGPASLPPPVSAAPGLLLADFGRFKPGPDVRMLANWIARTRDHQDRDFFVVDKLNATLYVFDHVARLRASSPVLLGAAVGDDSVPGIGTRPMAQIRVEERTTPAGRFVAEAGHNANGEDIVWVDYDAAVSMHRVRTGNRQERRAHRLATPTVADNRISYGCINVPAEFYERRVVPAFARHRTALVYVLPETRAARAEFGLDDASGLPPQPRRTAKAPTPN